MSWKNNRVYRYASQWINHPQEKPSLSVFTRVLWFLTGGGILSLVLLFTVLSFSDLPSFEELENPRYDLASIIYDAVERPYGKYYIENREHVPYDQLSTHIKDALFSVEDARYWRHSGIDFSALIRVAVKSILLRQESGGGGSTITQQLAKQLFDRAPIKNETKLSRAIGLANIKFKEWITSVRLERRYTKEEIVAMYLSKFEFINGAHGIQSAAEIYFDKNQKDLTIDEAATLVGMLKNPAYFNPVRFNARTKGRRDVVLHQMHKHDKINRVQRDTLQVLPLSMASFKKASQSEGLAPYFRSELTKWLRALLLQPSYLKSDGQPYDIYRDGLKIYTTIDADYQEKAEKALWKHMSKVQNRYWQVWRRLDPFTYDATDVQKRLRQEALNRRIRDTDYYKDQFARRFDELIKDVKNRYDLDLTDNTLRRWISDLDFVESTSEQNRGKWRRFQSGELVSEAKSLWKEFTANVDQFLNEKVDAQVFAYNDEGYEVKSMTRRDSIVYHLQHIQSGLVSVDPRSGEIKAWVGGADHRYFKYDHVNMRRQVGSTIKPFVYASAISVLGMSPCEQFKDIQYTIAPGDANFQVDKEWSPANSNNLFTQNFYNLYQGLLYSKNSITVRIVKEMGTMAPVRDLMHNLGISKEERLNGNQLLVPDLPSLCLGAVDLSVLEMAGAYTAFANDGVYTQPNFIRRIEDKNGKIIYQGTSVQRRAINPLYNAVIVDMLKNNVGGGFSMGLKSEVGGKTGTTNDFADGWFMGISPTLVTGVWAGGDEKFIRFLSLDDGQGFVMARPIFVDYMKSLEEDQNINFDVKARFKVGPPGFAELTDCSRHKSGSHQDENEQNIKKRADLEDFDELEDFDDLDKVHLRDTLIRNN